MNIGNHIISYPNPSSTLSHIKGGNKRCDGVNKPCKLFLPTLLTSFIHLLTLPHTTYNHTLSTSYSREGIGSYQCKNGSIDSSNNGMNVYEGINHGIDGILDHVEQSLIHILQVGYPSNTNITHIPPLISHLISEVISRISSIRGKIYFI